MEMTNVGNLLELRRIYSRGITGKGITTAVLDTGIYAHPDFFIPQNKILYFQDFVRNRRGPFDDNGSVELSHQEDGLEMGVESGLRRKAVL